MKGDSLFCTRGRALLLPLFLLLHAQIPDLRQRIFILSADSLEGRQAGTHSETVARQILSGWISQLTGLQAETHCFYFKGDDDAIRKACNLYVWPRDARRGDSLIVLMAHYDHIGWGGKRSRSWGRRAVHPGADDNASGVSALIEIMTCLHPSKLPVAYAFLTAHEEGLYGSRALTDALREMGQPVKLVINIDMVGRMDTMQRVLYISHTSNCPYIQELSRYFPRTWTIHTYPATLSESDCKWFQEIGIPCVFVTTGATHDDYHRISDKPDKLNFASIRLIAEGICAGILDLTGGASR